MIEFRVDRLHLFCPFYPTSLEVFIHINKLRISTSFGMSILTHYSENKIACYVGNRE